MTDRDRVLPAKGLSPQDSQDHLEPMEVRDRDRVFPVEDQDSQDHLEPREGRVRDLMFPAEDLLPRDRLD